MIVSSIKFDLLKKSRWICFIFLFLLPQLYLIGQFKPIGVPEIRNIIRSDYGGAPQNWSITDDEQGNIYVGNNSGIMRFDGEDWETFPVGNNSIVRSLAYGNDKKLYVGAYNEIGVLDKSDKEGIRYNSLNHLIPEYARNFDDIWNTCQTRFGVIFQSFEYIFIYTNDTIQVIEPGTRFGFSHYVNNNYYVVEKGIGLRILTNDSLLTVSDDPIFTQDEIHSLLPMESKTLLIGSQNKGLYTLSDGIVQVWDTEITRELRKNKLYCGFFNNENYLFGTIKSGIYVVNQDGNIQQHLSRSNGLQNNTILSLFIDHQNNIWLGLDNGIDYLKSSLPISYINDNFNIATTYATAIYRDRLYVGTNQGLYTKRLDNLKKHSDIKYELVEGTDGQVWNLSVLEGQLLCGHHKGAYLVDGTRSKRLTDTRGIWNFEKIPGHDDLLLSGTYDGLIILKKGEDGAWEFRNKIKDMDVSSKDLITLKDHILWMNHTYMGLFQIQLNETLDSVLWLKVFKGTNELPDDLPYTLHKSDNDFLISTSQGIYQYDRDEELFYRPENLNQFFGNLRLLYLLNEDSSGNIWYSAQQGLGVFRLLEDGTYTNITTPFLDLNNVRVSPFDNIYIQDSENIFIGTQKGLVHYDPSIYKNYFNDTELYINRIRISSKRKDSLWYSAGNQQMDEQLIKEKFSAPHTFNNISFRFNSTDLENAGNIEYSYRLVNFDENWSEWTSSNIKEYTNLSRGSYYFEVKAKNIYKNTSSVDQFHFMIEPPFYWTKIALILYFLLGTGLILTTIYFNLRRIDKVRSQEKNTQLKVFQQKEKVYEEQKMAVEKEVVHLKNEKLMADMDHKNKELATSTFHIIQKNKFLNALKQELSKLSQSAKSEFVEKELKKISRKIDRDIQHDKSWEVFDRYFDEVHQEFLKRLRELHPGLTPSELRLCAYLRMNISTKEIAPLMNISIRGVEISRYRLRKKLELDRNANLTEYIMQI